MRRRTPALASVIILILMMSGTVVSLATSYDPTVNSGVIYDDDFIAGGNSVTNDGTVKGDLLSISQRLNVRGPVEGDVIALAPDIYIGGDVGGSIRLAGTNVSVASRISRNAMIAASNLVLESSSTIQRNAYLYGGVVKSLGTVEGNTHIVGADISLGGTYNGDVNVQDLSENGSFSMLPGTVINGKLIYKGPADFYLPSYVQVQDYEFIKTSPPRQESARELDGMGIAKRIATLIVYYLFALLLYKLFPRFFVRSGKLISQKPIQVAGIGIATLGTFFGGLLLLLIIILLVIAILEFSVLGFTLLALLFFALVTVVFAGIPVSLWIGDLVIRNTDSVPAKLAIGLVIVSAVQLALGVMSSIPSVGAVFSVLGFLVNAAIWLLGTGAMLKTVFAMLKSANRQAEAEDLGIAE